MGGHEVAEIVFIHEVVVIVGIGVSRGEAAVLVYVQDPVVIVIVGNVVVITIIIAVQQGVGVVGGGVRLRSGIRGRIVIGSICGGGRLSEDLSWRKDADRDYQKRRI